MQLALRYDKAALPSHRAVCAATARAVVTLLADERSRGTGEWAPYVHRWRDGRIRKLARRARGVRWDRVQDLPGVTVVEGSAQVRAFVPRPARPLPPALDDLQVSGTSYPRREGDRDRGEDPDAPQEPGVDPDAPQDAGEGTDARQNGSDPVVIVALTPYAELTTGKAAAQCAHAAQLAWEDLVLRGEAATLRAWFEDGWRVAVVEPDQPAWEALAGAPISVVDAGCTEVDGPTQTARAWWRPIDERQAVERRTR